MVAPVVLLTVGGMLSNGLITIYSDINNRMREMTRERLEIRRGPAGQVLDDDSVPAIDQERLHEIDVQLPMMLRRHKLTRLSVLTIYVAIVVIGLSIVVIAIAVAPGRRDRRTRSARSRAGWHDHHAARPRRSRHVGGQVRRCDHLCRGAHDQAPLASAFRLV